MSNNVLDNLSKYPVVPVVVINSLDSAIPLADALIKGGLPVAEITFRTNAAADVIALLAKERPELILGAGTVLTAENLQKAKDCGAKFSVSPGLNPGVVKKAQDIAMPFMPGINNPTDIETAISLDCKKLKFFPAEVSGGIKYLNAISAPYKHLGIKFMPTGGINMGNLKDYLENSTVLTCGGTWIAKENDITQNKWNEITARCKVLPSVKSKQ